MMPIKWNEIPEALKDRMSQAFDVLTTADALVADEDRPSRVAARSDKILLDDLYLAATQPDSEVLAKVNKGMRQDPTLRRDFDSIVAQVSISHSAAAAAADTGDHIDRESGAFTIKLRPTRRRADQVYLLVQRNDGSVAPPRKLIVRCADGSVLGFTLPEPEGNLSQLLLDANHDVVGAISDSRTVLDLV